MELRPRLSGLQPGTPAGRVCVRVQRGGQRVSFRVEDDGRGLDVEAIRTTAIAGGLATPAAATRWIRRKWPSSCSTAA